MKTSFFKRKPDINAATIEYWYVFLLICECLAQAFYVAEDLEHAIEYYEKSADLDVEVGIG